MVGIYLLLLFGVLVWCSALKLLDADADADRDRTAHPRRQEHAPYIHEQNARSSTHRHLVHPTITSSPAPSNKFQVYSYATSQKLVKTVLNRHHRDEPGRSTTKENTTLQSASPVLESKSSAAHPTPSSQLHPLLGLPLGIRVLGHPVSRKRNGRHSSAGPGGQVRRVRQAASLPAMSRLLLASASPTRRRRDEIGMPWAERACRCDVRWLRLIE